MFRAGQDYGDAEVERSRAATFLRSEEGGRNGWVNGTPRGLGRGGFFLGGGIEGFEGLLGGVQGGLVSDLLLEPAEGRLQVFSFLAAVGELGEEVLEGEGEGGSEEEGETATDGRGVALDGDRIGHGRLLDGEQCGCGGREQGRSTD